MCVYITVLTCRNIRVEKFNFDISLNINSFVTGDLYKVLQCLPVTGLTYVSKPETPQP